MWVGTQLDCVSSFKVKEAMDTKFPEDSLLLDSVLVRGWLKGHQDDVSHDSIWEPCLFFYCPFCFDFFPILFSVPEVNTQLSHCIQVKIKVLLLCVIQVKIKGLKQQPNFFQINTIAQRDLSPYLVKSFSYTYLLLLCLPHPLTLVFTLCSCWLLFIIYLGGVFSSIH